MKSEIKGEPVVSVRLMTYNHAPYIAEAIESCLAQKTNFPFEIVIGDDFSTDGTREICERYAKEFPDKIRLLDRPPGGEYWLKRQELGRLYNFTNILKYCRGEYIALLDGDDYWINPNKLQRQFEILKANKDFTLCFHGSHIKTKKDLIEKDFSFLELDTISQEDLIIKTGNNFIPTASLFFRKEHLPTNFPDWFYKQSIGDWSLVLILLMNDRTGYFINEIFSAYRQEGQGLWEKTENIQLTLKKRNFVQQLMYSDLGLKQELLERMIQQYDHQLQGFIKEVNDRDFRNLGTSDLIKILLYRLKHAIIYKLSFASDS